MTGAIVIPASGETMDPVAAARAVAAGRGGLALCALGGGAIAGLAIALETWGGVPILVTGPAAVAGVAGGLVWLDGALARRGIRRSPLLGGEVRLSLGADGVRWRADRAEQEVAWDVFSDAFAVGGDLVLLARTGGFLGVPGGAGLLGKVEAWRAGHGGEEAALAFRVAPARYRRWERAAWRRLMGMDPRWPATRLALLMLAVVLVAPLVAAGLPVLATLLALVIAFVVFLRDCRRDGRRRARAKASLPPPEGTPEARLTHKGYRIEGRGWNLRGAWTGAERAVALRDGIALLVGARHVVAFPRSALDGVGPAAAAARIETLRRAAAP